ncbi:MAG: hypothetical protein KDD69_14180 [Bdellovibrionales bacterium]|nr:hypothetical protein [Bdellovibrionales bacterium]
MQIATDSRRDQRGQTNDTAPAQAAAPIDFYERDRQRLDPPFSSGESVRLQGRMQIGENGDVTVDPVYPGGLSPSIRTQFVIGNVNDKPELQELVGTSATVVLTVGEPKQSLFGHNYGATLSEKPQLHTIKDGTPATLDPQRGQYVGIAGQILEVNQVGEEDRARAQIKIRQENGSIITLNSHNPEIKFDGGVLENVSRKPVQVGDQVRAVAYVMPDSSLSIHYDAFLVEPSELRQQEYDARRTVIEGELKHLGNKISQENWSAARGMAATLALSETTRAEQLMLLAQVQSIPEAERPLINERLLEDRYAAEQLQENFGVNPMGFTKTEFIDFSKDLAAHRYGDIPALSETQTYRMFVDAGLSEAERQSVYTHVIAALKPVVAGANAANVVVSERLALDDSIRGLGGINTPESANQLVDTLIDEIGKRHLDPGGPLPPGVPRLESIVSTLTEAIDMRAVNNPNDRILQGRQGELVACFQLLQRFGVEPRAQQDLNNTINTLRNARGQEWAFNQLRFPKIGNS